MFLRLFTVSCFAWAAASGIFRTAAEAADPQGRASASNAADASVAAAIAPFDGLLLLKNGEVLEGSVSPAGDYYLVVTDNAELQIRFRDVQAVCRDLEEAFARRRAATITNPRNVDSRLEFAQWCIDRGLIGHAARELAEVYRLDDAHPRLALVERRLTAATSAPRAVPPQPKPATPEVDDERLAQTARSISPAALHEFTVRVQPLLMNYCATAGCHGPKPNSEYRLQRAYLNERSDVRVVRRNLHATLAQIDRRSPATSKLLTAPAAPHGGRSKPVFHAHNAEHFRQLAGWVSRVSGAATTPNAASPMLGDAPDALLQRLPIAAPDAPRTAAGSTSPAADSPPPKSPDAPASPPPTKPAADPLDRSSVDPFDPELFNRRHSAKKP